MVRIKALCCGNRHQLRVSQGNSEPDSFPVKSWCSLRYAVPIQNTRFGQRPTCNGIGSTRLGQQMSRCQLQNSILTTKPKHGPVRANPFLQAHRTDISAVETQGSCILTCTQIHRSAYASTSVLVGYTYLQGDLQQLRKLGGVLWQLVGIHSYAVVDVPCVRQHLTDTSRSQFGCNGG